MKSGYKCQGGSWFSGCKEDVDRIIDHKHYCYKHSVEKLKQIEKGKKNADRRKEAYKIIGITIPIIGLIIAYFSFVK